MDKTEIQLNLTGKMFASINKSKDSLDIHDYEFRVSSQWGEDGIIQFLINKIPIENKIFVEFGVESYQEANTRFLLQNDNWSGLVIDSSKENMESLKNSELYWKHSLTAISEFITKENIDDIISDVGISGDIGLLSIDVDGNDYWILDAVNCIKPRILIIEYNSLFGKNAMITVPYDEQFDRREKHYSNLYWGASISAITQLAKRRGYELIGSNTAGCNLFFVKKEFISGLKIMKAEDAYVESKFRQSIDESGNLTFLDNKKGFELIRDMEVVAVDSGKNVLLKNIKI